MAAGIVNIIGANINSEVSYAPNFANSGAVHIISRGDQYAGGGVNYRDVSSSSSPTVWTWVYYGIDASRSNSVYGKSSSVTPLSQRVAFLIRY